MKPGERWACVARQGGFGDNLIASTVLPGLKKRFDYVEVISGKPMHVMFENNPHIDKLTVLDKGFPDWGDGHTWQKWYVDRAKEYAFFANLSHSVECLGVLLRAQTAYWWPQDMRRQLCSKSYLELAHDICGLPYDEIAPDFYPTDEENAQAIETKAKVGERVVGWVLAGSRIDKHHHLADVMIAKVIRDLGLPVVLMGAPGKDYEAAKAVHTEVKKLNRSDDGLYVAISADAEKPTWPPRRVATMVQHCDVVVGPDSGPMWAVAMHELPKVLLASHAGPTNVTKHWKNTTTLQADPKRVPCFPCHRLHDDNTFCTPNADNNGAACISDITVEQVLEAVTNSTKKEQDDGKRISLFGKSVARLDVEGRRGTERPGDGSGGAFIGRADERQRLGDGDELGVHEKDSRVLGRGVTGGDE
jgi:ADP-heptose:LPS heptosyltransferase